MASKRIIILHETNGQPYFHALEKMAREAGDTVEFYGASVFRRLLGAVPKRTFSARLVWESWRNLRFRFRQFFLGEGVVVACFAPYDFRLLYFLPLWWNRRLVVIEHTSWPYWWTRRVPRANGPLWKLAAAVYHRWLRRRAAWIVTVLEEGKRQLATRPGLEDKCVVIPHTNRLTPSAAAPRADGPLRVLFVGKLLPEKGVAAFLETARALRPTMKFTVVGSGTLEPAVAHAAAAGDIAHRPHVSDGGELSSLYSQHDILVVPSVATPRWEELFGIVIIEAMAHGLVPVASNHVGPRNIITDGTDGILMPHGTAAEIETVLRGLDADREKLRALRAHAAASARAYEIGSVAARWKTLFDRLA